VLLVVLLLADKLKHTGWGHIRYGLVCFTHLLLAFYSPAIDDFCSEFGLLVWALCLG